MMSRVVITLRVEEREALIKWASSELRTPNDQARYIIRIALQNKGLLPELEILKLDGDTQVLENKKPHQTVAAVDEAIVHENPIGTIEGSP
jgi:hypothetical protein